MANIGLNLFSNFQNVTLQNMMTTFILSNYKNSKDRDFIINMNSNILFILTSSDMYSKLEAYNGFESLIVMNKTLNNQELISILKKNDSKNLVSEFDKSSNHGFFQI